MPRRRAVQLVEEGLVAWIVRALVWTCPSRRGRSAVRLPVLLSHRVLAGFNDLVRARNRHRRAVGRGRNGGVRPEGIGRQRLQEAWWVCDSGHSWRMSVYNRTAGADRGCPYCGGRKASGRLQRPGDDAPALGGPVGLRAQWEPAPRGRARRLVQAGRLGVRGGAQVVGPRCEQGQGEERRPGLPLLQKGERCSPASTTS